MYFIKLHYGIHKIIEGYNRFGFWHRGDEATVKETSIKIVLLIYYALFPLALITGAIASDNRNESMFLVEATIISSVLLVRLMYTMLGQKEMYELLHRIGVYSVKYEEDFNFFDSKLKSFMKWIAYFSFYTIVVSACIALIFPLIGSDKKLFFNIGFPFAYKNNDVAYGIAVLFIFSEVCLSIVSVWFSIIKWYLLINCTLKYKALGSELRKLGVIRTLEVKGKKMSENEKRKCYNRNLIDGIELHKEINEATQQLESFLSKLFSVQLATSAFCICTSVYSLASNHGENIMELQIYVFGLFYNIFDIFMEMYFGNEIQLSSDALSYQLFQSNWMEQSQSCKKLIIIFGERLKQPQQMVVLKIYPLNLETFTRILNGAYSMFNILENLS